MVLPFTAEINSLVSADAITVSGDSLAARTRARGACWWNEYWRRLNYDTNVVEAFEEGVNEDGDPIWTRSSGNDINTDAAVTDAADRLGDRGRGLTTDGTYLYIIQEGTGTTIPQVFVYNTSGAFVRRFTPYNPNGHIHVSAIAYDIDSELLIMAYLILQESGGPDSDRRMQFVASNIDNSDEPLNGVNFQGDDAQINALAMVGWEGHIISISSEDEFFVYKLSDQSYYDDISTETTISVQGLGQRNNKLYGVDSTLNAVQVWDINATFAYTAALTDSINAVTDTIKKDTNKPLSDDISAVTDSLAKDTSESLDDTISDVTDTIAKFTGKPLADTITAATDSITKAKHTERELVDPEESLSDESVLTPNTTITNIRGMTATPTHLIFGQVNGSNSRIAAQPYDSDTDTVGDSFWSLFITGIVVSGLAVVPNGDDYKLLVAILGPDRIYDYDLLEGSDGTITFENQRLLTVDDIPGVIQAMTYHDASGKVLVTNPNTDNIYAYDYDVDAGELNNREALNGSSDDTDTAIGIDNVRAMTNTGNTVFVSNVSAPTDGSITRAIYAFDYDPVAETLTNRRKLLDIVAINGTAFSGNRLITGRQGQEVNGETVTELKSYLYNNGEYPITDTITRTATRTRALSDDITAVTDSIQADVPAKFTLTDTIAAPTDSITKNTTKTKALTDSISAITDSLQKTTSIGRALTDTITAVTDSLTRRLAATRSLDDTISAVTDSLNKNTADTKNLTDAIAAPTDEIATSKGVTHELVDPEPGTPLGDATQIGTFSGTTNSLAYVNGYLYGWGDDLYYAAYADGVLGTVTTKASGFRYTAMTGADGELLVFATNIPRHLSVSPTTGAVTASSIITVTPSSDAVTALGVAYHDTSGKVILASTLGLFDFDYNPVTYTLTNRRDVTGVVTPTNIQSLAIHNDTLITADIDTDMIYAYDYDSATGALSNERVLFAEDDIEAGVVVGDEYLYVLPDNTVQARTLPIEGGSFAITDSIAKATNESLADTISGVTDSVARRTSIGKSLSDTISAITDSIAQRHTTTRSLSDSISAVTDSLTHIAGDTIHLSDSIAAITDTITKSTRSVRELVDPEPSLSNERTLATNVNVTNVRGMTAIPTAIITGNPITGGNSRIVAQLYDPVTNTFSGTPYTELFTDGSISSLVIVPNGTDYKLLVSTTTADEIHDYDVTVDAAGDITFSNKRLLTVTNIPHLIQGMAYHAASGNILVTNPVTDNVYAFDYDIEAGTMNNGDADGRVALTGGYVLANARALTMKGSTLFVADISTSSIYSLQYNSVDGTLTKRRDLLTGVDALNGLVFMGRYLITGRQSPTERKSYLYTDSYIFSDSISKVTARGRSLSDSISAVTDSVHNVAPQRRSLADTIAAVTDSVQRATSHRRALSDTVAAVTDSIAAGVAKISSLADSIAAVTDSLTSDSAKTVSLADSITAPTDSLSTQKTYVRVLADTIGAVTDSVSRTAAFVRQLADTIKAVTDRLRVVRPLKHGKPSRTYSLSYPIKRTYTVGISLKPRKINVINMRES